MRRLSKAKREQYRARGYWVPLEGPQEFAIYQAYENVSEILFGGARGPGKTEAGLAWLLMDIKNPQFRALVIRKNADDLSDWIDRATKMYSPLGATIAYKPAIITFPWGAKIKTGHLKDDQAYTKYQGHEYQRMLIEELTQVPTEKRYLQLIGSCRSTVPGLKSQVFATTNPGGIGHQWVKARFIDDKTPNKPYTDPDTTLQRIFIPATIDNNPLLMAADPQYVQYLEGLKQTDEDLWKAWRLGDWDIFAGQAFREFRRDLHVCSPGNEFGFPISECQRFIGYDWGYAAPGCAMWVAITPENKQGVRRICVYRELYQTGKHPEEWANELRLINEVDAKNGCAVKHIILPHDCFNKETGDSIAEIFRRVGKLNIFAARTLERGARLNRKALLHRALSMAADGRPYLLIHPRCSNLIRTLPSLVYDETNPEDIDTEGEDHAYDALTIVLLTELPYFFTSGGVKRKESPYQFKRTFATTPSGQLHGPDFWEAMKKQQHTKRRIQER